MEITLENGTTITLDKSKSNEVLELIKDLLPKPKLPKTWEELEAIKGYYVSIDSTVLHCPNVTTESQNRSLFTTKEEVQAVIAMAQLCQLRNYYNSTVTEIVIGFHVVEYYDQPISWLSFKTKELRDEFENNFIDLIKQVEPFLFCNLK